MRMKLTVLIMVVAMLGMVACKKKTDDQSGAGSTSAASGSNPLVGKWTIDLENIKNDPKVKAAGPMAAQMLKMFEGMTIEFSDDTMTANMLGKKTGGKYELVKSNGDSATIKILDGKEKGQQKTIKIIDGGKKIELPSEGKGPALVLKRA